MLKQNKIKIIIASVIILLPTILGSIFWSKLPELFPSHWGINGADSFVGKGFFVFGMPLIMLALFFLCLFVTSKDKKNQEQSAKVSGMIFWIVPFISLFIASISYFGAKGKSLELISVIPIVLGIMFAVMGNYMPKCRPNRTIGIRVKWTLENEENWNATHRFAGKVMVLSGLLTVFCCFLPEFWGAGVALALILISVITVFVYSFVYYKKQKALGTYVVNTGIKQLGKAAKIAIVIVISAILIGVAVLMFTGEITVSVSGQMITVDSTYYSETVFELDAIDTVQYIENFDGGLRTSGFHSAKLALGNYENEKYKFLSYRYTNVDSCVVLFTDHGIIAINQPTEEATKTLYEELLEKTSK